MFTLFYHYLDLNYIMAIILFLTVGFNIALCFMEVDYKALWRILGTIFGCDLIGIAHPGYALTFLSMFALAFALTWFIKCVFSAWEKFDGFFVIFWW